MTSFNRLKNEKSPYLQQHAQNRVDWYPWGDEAFTAAEKEDKPVFLSIGYSTCHWCHVMERESFQNEEVAKLLNDTFINIKVDREERPDIDAVYMKVCQMQNGSGGWPLTVMMTPDKKPFFTATYIPRQTRYGHVGLLEMIPQVKMLWRTRRADVVSSAQEITLRLARTDHVHEEGEASGETLHKAYHALEQSYDFVHGGFGSAPKFPTPHNFFFLLRYWKKTGRGKALAMAEHTLQNMRRGGIYDHIGFGFHRYATDTGWVVPHFEKMLYDQALMAMAYIELYQATGKKEYELTAREVFTYVLRDLTDVQGGFYCAQDADSEGVEGKFYLWTEDEIRRLLPADDAQLFLSCYRHETDRKVPAMQEMPPGCFIPHLKSQSDDKEQTNEAPVSDRMKEILTVLFDIRRDRVHPHKDDKILTDWNGLMIAALARGGQVFDEPVYTAAAKRAMDFVLRFLLTAEGRLLHMFRDGLSAVDGNIDDYSFIIWALLELYETTFDVEYLFRALEFQSHLSAFFRDENRGGYFFTASDAERLIKRPKELYDGAVPSGNSLAFLNALRLSRFTGDAEMDERAHEVYRAFRAPAEAVPSAFTQFLCGLDFALGPVSEIVIVGKEDAEDTRLLLAPLRKKFLPNKVVIFRPDSPVHAQIDTIASFVTSLSAVNSQATAYVCRNFACALPVNDARSMMDLLEAQDDETPA